MDRRGMIGQKLVTGLPGYEITEEFRCLVKEWKIGNVILFARNIESPAQLKCLCSEIQTLVMEETGLPAFIAIDQEGGNLTRLHAPATVLPGAMALGAADDEAFAALAGEIAGKELLACGVNLNLAPVMDVNSNPDNPVIGARSFGSDPQLVARMGCAWAQGLRKSGMLDCAKHFPGHGDTKTDSHLDLPVIDKDLQTLRSCELLPFEAAVKAGACAVMTAHILFPKVEKEKLPATMSPAILQGLLRKEMSFDGLIISDCMMMDAISKYYGTLEGTLAAARAGVDLVLICHSNDLAAQTAAAMESDLEEELLEQSYARIKKAKERLAKTGYSLECVGCVQHRKAAEEIVRKSLTFVGGPSGRLPNLGCKPLFACCEPFRTTQAADPTACSGGLSRALQSRFGGTAVEMPCSPTTENIQQLLSMAKEHTALVLSTFNARQQPQQLQLVREMKNVDVPVVLLAMRDPYDLMGMVENCWCIAAYDYTETSVAALCDALAGRYPLQGRLPVKF